MAMPGKPAASMGAEGQTNVGWDAKPSEGAQQHGPNSPTHGAAGGLDVNFGAVAPDLFTPGVTHTGASDNPVPLT